MASPRGAPEVPPLESPRTLRRRTVLGIPPIDVTLLVLVGVAAGFGLNLLLAASARQLGATVIAAVLVAVGTYRTIQVTREGQITERLSQAVTQLDAKDTQGKPNEVVVLGGIYALERIAANSKSDYQTIMEILTSFVRVRVPLPKGGADELRSDVPKYVQAALAVLARRTSLRKELRLDLHGTDLRDVLLPGAQFQRALLTDSWLCNADLRGADLRGADLRGAHLTDAYLHGADLRGADLRGADLRGADLLVADQSQEGKEGSAASSPISLQQRIDDVKRLKLAGVKSDKSTMWPKGFEDA